MDLLTVFLKMRVNTLAVSIFIIRLVVKTNNLVYFRPLLFVLHTLPLQNNCSFSFIILLYNRCF